MIERIEAISKGVGHDVDQASRRDVQYPFLIHVADVRKDRSGPRYIDRVGLNVDRKGVRPLDGSQKAGVHRDPDIDRRYSGMWLKAYRRAAGTPLLSDRQSELCGLPSGVFQPKRLSLGFAVAEIKLEEQPAVVRMELDLGSVRQFIR